MLQLLVRVIITCKLEERGNGGGSTYDVLRGQRGGILQNMIPFSFALEIVGDDDNIVLKISVGWQFVGRSMEQEL